MPCSDRYCKGSFIDSNIKAAKVNLEELLAKAEVYLKQFYLNKNRWELIISKLRVYQEKSVNIKSFSITHFSLHQIRRICPTMGISREEHFRDRDIWFNIWRIAIWCTISLEKWASLHGQNSVGKFGKLQLIN